MDMQQVKERACHLAAMRGYALFSRGRQIYAVLPEGKTILICGSRHPCIDLWLKAYQNIHAEPYPKYRLVTPNKTYVADTWYGLCWNLLRNNHVVQITGKVPV